MLESSLTRPALNLTSTGMETPSPTFKMLSSNKKEEIRDYQTAEKLRKLRESSYTPIVREQYQSVLTRNRKENSTYQLKSLNSRNFSSTGRQRPGQVSKSALKMHQSYANVNLISFHLSLQVELPNIKSNLQKSYDSSSNSTQLFTMRSQAYRRSQVHSE